MKGIPIIYYHSVGIKNPYWRKNFLTLELSFFEDQLRFFAKKFSCISLKDYWELQNEKKAPPINPIVITFDDGYLDNWQYAYPLLKKYGLKGTIFVSPEFVDLKNGVRPNLEDVWNGKAQMEDLNQWGFLSWEEMRIMEESGVIDIQSHTMTHTKYPVSDKLVGFHRPGADCLYYSGNQFTDRKPYYIDDPGFETLMPYGYPIFEMQSSVIAQKKAINPEFIDFCIKSFRKYNFNNYSFETALSLVNNEYQRLKKEDRLIMSEESREDYESRLKYEIYDSKRILEENLNKTIDFLCWPHGDNSEDAHQMAMEAGYKSTMWGKLTSAHNQPDRIPARIGSSAFRDNRQLTLLRMKFKISVFLNRFPAYHFHTLYQKIRY